MSWDLLPCIFCLVFCCLVFDYLLFAVLHLLSCTGCLAFAVLYLLSCICCPVFAVLHLLSCICYLAFAVLYLLSMATGLTETSRPVDSSVTQIFKKKLSDVRCEQSDDLRVQSLDGVVLNADLIYQMI